ncbi:MAG TPA: tetratricopeptide repeat protein [Thermoanaerobaculia bacterium]|nr:tetratricopeptide repeat protein [Thermoanaerobaculia bacterium]
MKPRTLFILLGALLVTVVVSFLSVLNRDLLVQPFWLSGVPGAGWNVPLFVVMLALFLSGFLPVVSRMLFENVRRDLAERRARRESRAEESLDQTYRRAVDLLEDGQVSRAARELEVVLAARPDDFSALLACGGALRTLGRPAEAIRVHQRAAEAYPRSVAMQYALAAAFDASGDRSTGDEIRNRILREFPGRGLAVLRERRQRAVSAGDWRTANRLQDEIDALLESVGETYRHAPEVRQGLVYQRAVTLLEEERPDDAIEVLGELVEQEPAFVAARILLGEARLLQGRPDEAVRAWREGFEATGSPTFLLRVEDHFIESAEPQLAIDTLRELIAGRSDDLLARFFLGRLYYRLEMHDDAWRTLAPLEDRLASSPTFHFLLGRIHERRGEIARAAERFQESARLLGVRNAEFTCRSCGRRYGEWMDRCEGCGAWSSVELSLDLDRLAPESQGVAPAPVWPGAGED